MTSSSSAGKRKRYCSEVHLGDRVEPENGPPLSTQGPELHSGHEDDLNNPGTRPKKREKTQSILEEDVHAPPPSTSRYLPIVFGGSRWRGLESFENIVIIGDSYSKLYEGKTWVDHLERRLREHNNPAKIHNFAFPGATGKDDLSDQLSRFFATSHKKDSRLVFLGINDCGSTESDELEPIMEIIFDAVHNLYVKARGRNFVLVDVPPTARSPQAVNSRCSDEIEQRVTTWNDLLREQTVEFGAGSTEATMLLFSSHQVLTEVLEDPFEFDFSEDDPTTEGGGIWEDGLHLTTDVHHILGERLLASVLSQL